MADKTIKKSILICIPSFDTKIHLETISSIISTRDLDKNGSIDPLMFNSQQNKNGEWDMFPVQFWDNLIQQSPLFRKEFNSYHAFSKANMNYYQEKEYLIKDSLLSAKHDTSKWLENLGSNTFKLNTLPDPLQLGLHPQFLFGFEVCESKKTRAAPH